MFPLGQYLLTTNSDPVWLQASVFGQCCLQSVSHTFKIVKEEENWVWKLACLSRSLGNTWFWVEATRSWLFFKHRAHLTNRQLWMICSTLNHKIQQGVPRIWIMRQREKREQASSNEVSPTKEKKNNGKAMVISSQGVFSNIGWQLSVREFNPNPCVWSCFSLANCNLFYGGRHPAERE